MFGLWVSVTYHGFRRLRTNHLHQAQAPIPIRLSHSQLLMDSPNHNPGMAAVANAPRPRVHGVSGIYRKASPAMMQRTKLLLGWGKVIQRLPSMLHGLFIRFWGKVQMVQPFDESTRTRLLCNPFLSRSRSNGPVLSLNLSRNHRPKDLARRRRGRGREAVAILQSPTNVQHIGRKTNKQCDLLKHRLNHRVPGPDRSHNHKHKWLYPRPLKPLHLARGRERQDSARPDHEPHHSLYRLTFPNLNPKLTSSDRPYRGPTSRPRTLSYFPTPPPSQLLLRHPPNNSRLHNSSNQ